ncbi:MAG: DUF302 domain-containing protein [Actinobacteria bacterium]|nr:DUF302 domain-containing protein [Actinomycetota bacterium]
MANSSFGYVKTLAAADIATARPQVEAALKEHGFGVLTEIDVAATMKKKLDKDMAGYLILGACNPGLAWQAMACEPRVGAMLPCNVILRQLDDGVEVSAVDPAASMKAIDNADLERVAGKVRGMLEGVVGAI